MVELTLRPANSSDLPWIGKLCASSTGNPAEGIGYPRCEDEHELLAELALYEHRLEDNILVACTPAGDPIGFGGFLVSDTDEASFVIGPLIAAEWRTPVVTAEFLRLLVAQPLGGRVLSNYIEEGNTILEQALLDTGWHPGKVQLEMRYDLASAALPDRGPAHPVRPLNGQDDPAFGPMAELLARHHGWGNDPQARLADYLEDGYLVAVSEQDGRPVGCVLWIYVDGTNFARLDYLSVDEDFRGKGHGSTMVRHVLLDAQEHPGTEYLFLSVDPENDPAYEIYRRHGFVDNVRSRKYTYDRG